MMPARSPEQEQFAGALHDMLGAAAAATAGAARQWAAGDRAPGWISGTNWPEWALPP
jgi:hypothetical protein